MNDLRTQVRDIARRRRTVPTRLLDVAIAAILALIITGWAMHEPSRAPDVTIDNETPFDLTIKVGNAQGDNQMGFALVDAHSQTVVRAPVDQGQVWVLSFGPGGEYPIDRNALREAGWHIHVPPSVAEQMAAAGVAPSPQRSTP